MRQGTEGNLQATTSKEVRAAAIGNQQETEALSLILLKDLNLATEYKSNK